MKIINNKYNIYLLVYIKSQMELVPHFPQLCVCKQSSFLSPVHGFVNPQIADVYPKINLYDVCGL